MYKRVFAALIAVFVFFSAASAQKAEITVSLNEAFFDALLDSTFQNFDPPQFSIAQNVFHRGDAETQSQTNVFSGVPSNSFISSATFPQLRSRSPGCSETVKILREMNGVRTAVRFRDGKIFVPLAFSGSYAPPFVGCVDFAGWAETNVDLDFDQNGQRLVGRARVLNVNLNGSGGVGGTVIAKLIQSSIDKKLNPIEIMSLDKISFSIPIQNTGNLRMKALGVRPEIGVGFLDVHVSYAFLKS